MAVNPFAGRQIQYVIAIENAKTPGTKAVLTDSKYAGYPVLHTGGSLQPNRMKQNLEGSVGTLTKNFGTMTYRVSAEGDLPILIDTNSLGAFLSLVFSKAPATTADGSGFLHTYVKDDEQSLGPTLTLFNKNPTYQEAYPRSRIKTTTIEFVENSWAKASFSFITDTPVVDTTDISGYTIDASTLPFFKPVDLSVKAATNSTGIAAAEEIRVKSAKITITEDREGYGSTGNTSYLEIPSTGFDVKVEIVALFDSQVHRNNWIGDNYQYWRFKQTGNRAISSITPYLEFNINSGIITEWKHSTDLGSVVEQTFTITAHDTSGSTFDAKLFNQLSATIAKYGVDFTP